MIPKVIHYCWLSNDPFPRNIRRCMNSWRKVMPGYEIKRWSLENFDAASAPVYVQEAIKARKWAFAADYIRIYALYTEGGFYMDSDVIVLKPFDDFRKFDFISSLEYHPKQIERNGIMNLIDENGNRKVDAFISGIQIQAAVMGAKAGCPFFRLQPLRHLFIRATSAPQPLTARSISSGLNPTDNRKRRTGQL